MYLRTVKRNLEIVIFSRKLNSCELLLLMPPPIQTGGGIMFSDWRLFVPTPVRPFPRSFVTNRVNTIV